MDLEIHALAWLGKYFIDGAHVVVDVCLFVPKHSKESIYMVFIELNFITQVTVIFALSKVLDSARCSCIQFDLGEKKS